MYGVRFFSWVNLSGGGKNGGGSRGAKRAKRLGGKNCVISQDFNEHEPKNCQIVERLS